MGCPARRITMTLPYIARGDVGIAPYNGLRKPLRLLAGGVWSPRPTERSPLVLCRAGPMCPAAMVRRVSCGGPHGARPTDIFRWCFRRARCPRSGAKRNKYPWGASCRTIDAKPPSPHQSAAAAASFWQQNRKILRQLFSRIILIDRPSSQYPHQPFAVERDQGIEIPLAHHRLGGGDQRHRAHHTGGKAPAVPQPDQHQ